MKTLIRILIVEALVLYAISYITTGLNFENGTSSLIVTAIFLSIASFVVKPVINLFLLPLNLLTFGFFRFLTNAITLYLVDLVLKEFSVGQFFFKGLNHTLLITPSFSVPEGPFSYLAFSFLLSFVTGIIYWLIV
jgi:putative membrane protein